jgi:4-diphosphocytidyl-2-C-methyl-D-erythritol kinase
MKIPAPAKLNLFLHICGRRADGFHLLDSLYVFTEFGDHVSLRPATNFDLQLSGEFSNAVASGEENIALKAARKLARYANYDSGVSMHLEKNIPVGAGLGGGSADAGAALRGVRDLWNCPVSDSELQELALSLGSDIPACVMSRACQVRGVGEWLIPVFITPEVWVLLVNPRIELLTAQVYRNYTGAFRKEISLPERINSFDELIALLTPVTNDLQEPAISMVPDIAKVITAIESTEGCRISRMSGSGATCFGLYESKDALMTAAREVEEAHPKWWCKATKLRITQ